MKEGCMTTGEALAFLGIHQHTFEKYTRLLGITGEHVGRCTFYRNEDIERMKNAVKKKVPSLAEILRRAGYEVTLTPKK